MCIGVGLVPRRPPPLQLSIGSGRVELSGGRSEAGVMHRLGHLVQPPGLGDQGRGVAAARLAMLKLGHPGGEHAMAFGDEGRPGQGSAASRAAAGD